MTKKPLVVREYSKIVAKDEYLQLYKNRQKYVISYKYISAIFINFHIKISLKSIIKLTAKFSIYLIDENGYIKTKISKVQENENL